MDSSGRLSFPFYLFIFLASYTPSLYYRFAALFDGPAYRTLDCTSLSAIEMGRCEENVAFLSGLYGILKPSDHIQRHRLEMGTKNLPIPTKSLYKYWHEKMALYINEHFGNEEPGVSPKVFSLLILC